MTRAATTQRVSVEPIETIFRINGAKLRKAIEAVGLKQSDLSDACGHKDSTWVCRLLNSEYRNVSGKHLQPMVDRMIEAGIEVEGFYDE